MKISTAALIAAIFFAFWSGSYWQDNQPHMSGLFNMLVIANYWIHRWTLAKGV